jgi:glutamine synthetase
MTPGLQGARDAVAERLAASTDPERLVGLVAANLIGQLRGKMVPLSDLPKRLETGVGWTPVNTTIDPFGAIPADNPYGSLGDLQMRPVLDSEIHVGGSVDPALHYYMCDLYDQAGTRWPGCPRGALVAALQALEDATGLQLQASFEHEFMLVGAPLTGSGYSFERVRAAEPFPSALVAALSEAGCEPETILSEYGADQFEVTCRPAAALQAADRALAVREIAREIARTCGWRATFTPLVEPDAVGNGVHIHLSLWSGDTPATYDKSGIHGLSATAAAFVAGILAHAESVCSLTAASPVSYGRLQPGRWSAGRAALATGDREALLRIQELGESETDEIQRGFNFEFRAVDATASPHLALAALVRAGVSGIKDGLTLRDGPDGAVAVSEAGDVATSGLPTSLDAALDAFEGDDATPEWLSSALRAAYLSLKRHEIRSNAADDFAVTCTRYANAY